MGKYTLGWFAFSLCWLLASCQTDSAHQAASGQPPSAAASTNSEFAVPLKSGQRSLLVDGVKRTFILHVPASYDPARKTPLVVDYHGLFGNGADHMRGSGYMQVADRENFLVAYPDGIDHAWNLGPCCTLSRQVDDVAFARAVVAELKREANIAEDQIYAAGFSNGGGMAQYLACHAADLFAAIAPAAFDLLEENSPGCAPVRPIPVLLTRGLADKVVTYTGGPSNPPNGLQTTIHFMGAQATFKRWAELNQCTDTPVKDQAGCEIHRQCAAGVEVGLCSIPGGGHAPGDATMGWNFLKRFKKP